jgi:hypothetical protein
MSFSLRQHQSTSLIRLALSNPALSNADASGMHNNDLQSYLSMCGTDLQAALDKHWDNVLRLLRMGTTAGQNIIPKKMLTKVREANMTPNDSDQYSHSPRWRQGTIHTEIEGT